MKSLSPPQSVFEAPSTEGVDRIPNKVSQAVGKSLQQESDELFEKWNTNQNGCYGSFRQMFKYFRSLKGIK